MTYEEEVDEQRAREVQAQLEGTMFDIPHARASDPDTSHAAAESMTEGASIQRRQILTALIQGDLTANALDRLHGWRDGTAGRRMGELTLAGLAHVAGEGVTESGRRAQTYSLGPPWTEVSGA